MMLPILTPLPGLNRFLRHVNPRLTPWARHPVAPTGAQIQGTRPSRGSAGVNGYQARVLLSLFSRRLLLGTSFDKTNCVD